jgi:hypothetical protein
MNANPHTRRASPVLLAAIKRTGVSIRALDEVLDRVEVRQEDGAAHLPPFTAIELSLRSGVDIIDVSRKRGKMLIWVRGDADVGYDYIEFASHGLFQIKASLPSTIVTGCAGMRLGEVIDIDGLSHRIILNAYHFGPETCFRLKPEWQAATTPPVEEG